MSEAAQQAPGQAPQEGADGSESLETSNYEVIRRRLVEHGRQLGQKADVLNERRQDFFGSTSMEVIGNETIRTDASCIPQDIINLGDRLLFGYNVTKKRSSIQVPEVFSLHKYERDGEQVMLRHLPQDTNENFLGQAHFNKDFNDLYSYYKDAYLRQLRRVDGTLLAIFQTGTQLADIRVLRWAVDAEWHVNYLDNAGEREHKQLPTHDFEWIDTTREQHVAGKHPHVNILDEVFVETVGGDLTIKIENNTETGQGIYAEKVKEKNQSLGDAEILYAPLGSLILLKILPYREQSWFHLVYNRLTKTVHRIDAIGQSCRQLPEEHGIIFPGGYALESGEVKRFDIDVAGMRLEQVVPSPNGEDVLYAYYRDEDGSYLLLSYNLIRKEVQNPIPCHGYSVFEDGTMIIFRSTGDQATRVHPMQIWRTPYLSDEAAAAAPSDGSFLSKIGNADLVRGISDAFTIRKMINNQEPTTEVYASIITAAERMLDTFYWLNDTEAGQMHSSIKEVIQTAQLVIDEFQKVRAMREQARIALEEARVEQARLFADIRYANWRVIDRFVDGLDGLRKQRGRVITMREMKFIDLKALDNLEAQVVEQYDKLSKATVQFLLGEEALGSYMESIEKVITSVEALATTVEANEVKARIDQIGEGLNLLTEVISGLKIEDPTARTKILETIAEVLGQQNRSRAMLEARRRTLLEQEGRAEFAVQFQLLGQSVTSALGMCETPEKCDDQLTRLMIQLEEVESRFSEFDTFIAKLSDKRLEISEAFESKKQQLVDERQRKASTIIGSAERTLASVQRRAQKMKDVEALNAYFAADSSIIKLREQAERLRELNEVVKADDIEAQLKAARDQAIRSLRDKLDLFEGGADAIIKFGRHRFSVNTQQIELTMVPRGDEVRLHISGTDFYEPITDPKFLATRHMWSQHLVSETPEVYRAEYLAASILFDAQIKAKGYTVGQLHEQTTLDQDILKVIRAYIEERYDEGYERGVHDTDTMLILRAITSLYMTAGLLRFGPKARALATLFWATPPEADPQPPSSTSQRTLVTSLAERQLSQSAPSKVSEGARQRALWQRRAQSLGRLRAIFSDDGPLMELAQDIATGVEAFAQAQGQESTPTLALEAAQYLIEELIAPAPKFVLSADAENMVEKFLTHLDVAGTRQAFDEDVSSLDGELQAAQELVRGWMKAFLSTQRDRFAEVMFMVPEAIAHLLTRGKLDREVSSARVTTKVDGLLGQHPRIMQQTMAIRLDELLTRLRHFVSVRIPEYRQYRSMSNDVLDQTKRKLRLDELKPRVLTTFVRNRLIDETYLPIIGDNLAKQMGSVGESGRSDRMGLLLLISPPGYGKTTLMEYIANRLGLIFMKINGPALGHQVASLDPTEAPNATARQEVEKINLALRMGNNVMLYLDDIQHTNPELLQKFISLCDATRRIEGVWQGETKTYDLRGKRFSVVMAGNPYTETGERFQIPDMLANRADTYNLGDILEGSEQVFALSYIENALTSNPVLAPLANREREDVHKFIRMAQGEQIPLSELTHGYSAQEAKEIVDVLQKLFVCQEVLLKVNQTYIISAAQDDNFRSEPPFKLQGSYRNMTKLAEKIVSAMNDKELSALIDDHYAGESQTLTTDSEHNLLKLAELRGKMTPEQQQRWEEIKREFKRRKMMGGGDDDPVTRVVGPLSGLVDKMDELHETMRSSSKVATGLDALRESISEAAQHVMAQDAKRGPGVDAQMIEALTKAVSSIATQQKPAPPVEDPRANVGQIIEKQMHMVEGALNSLVRIVEAHMQSSGSPQLMTQLKALERWMEHGGGPLLQGPPASGGGQPAPAQAAWPAQPQPQRESTQQRYATQPGPPISGTGMTQDEEGTTQQAATFVPRHEASTTQPMAAVQMQQIAADRARQKADAAAQEQAQEAQTTGNSFRQARKSMSNIKPLSEDVSEAYAKEQAELKAVQLRPPFNTSEEDED